MKLRLIITFAILAAIFAPLYAQNESDFYIRQNADDTLTITGYDGAEKDVVIPDTLYGLKVTIIGEGAFFETGITSVIIPDTVVAIEDGRYIDAEINTGAFSHNSQLTKVTLGKGLETIGAYAFSYTQLSEIIIPDSVTSIGECAFLGRTFGSPMAWDPQTWRDYPNGKLAKVIFGTGLQIIGEEAFRSNRISVLNLPSSLKEIKGGAFADNRIQSLTIPEGVTSLNSFRPDYNSPYVGVFADNRELSNVVIPASLAKGEFSDQFLSDRNNITYITIPEEIDEQLLRGNFEESFVNFWINQNKAGGTYIKDGSIWYRGDNENGVIFNANKTTLLYCPKEKSGHYTIPNSVTSIGNGAFGDCTSLTSITIPNSVISIGGFAFRACFNLSSITIPESVTSIGNGAFASCTSLTSITIPDSVISIGEFAFRACFDLSSITISNSITAIENGTFFNCYRLTSITIPNSVVSIGNWAFEKCRGLISITIPNNITSIGQTAFGDCTSLTSVTFENSISANNFHTKAEFPGDLRDKYLAESGGIGTYTRESDSDIWTKR